MMQESTNKPALELEVQAVLTMMEADANNPPSKLEG
jgi:hypothetical protein